MKERTKLAIILVAFGACWFLPTDNERFMNSVYESLVLVRWYAREHVLLCLVPAFFIAGAISVFVSQGAVMKYLGARAKKIIAYPVAAVSGTILAVCSCTVLPIFASIHKRGAGLGPASAFLYSGPAINVLAIILTARVLGLEIGLARAIGAILFAIVIGLLMQFIFRKDERKRADGADLAIPDDDGERKLWQDSLYLLSLVAILVFANWGKPDSTSGIWWAIYSAKWVVTGIFLVVLLGTLVKWFDKDELLDWVDESWMFTKQILPLLLAGVLIAGMLLGGPHSEGGLIPKEWIAKMVGGNSLGANLFASISGAFMYFATLTEVPILEGLLNSGMGKGPALALLLSGPAVSLPNMLVIRSVIGTKKTAVYIGLVVLLSTGAGWIYGSLF